MARRRMDDQPLRLVDNDHVRVLIHHVQRNVLRLQRGLLRGKGGEGEETVLDLGEDALRLLVILDRAGVFEGK